MRHPLRLADILDHPECNGIYRLHDTVSLDHGMHISGRDLTGKQAILKALSSALFFPDYFGFNWDAAEECLSDLGWYGGPVVLLIDSTETPARMAPDAWQTLLDLLSDAADFWKAQGRPFVVFLQGGHAVYPVVT